MANPKNVSPRLLEEALKVIRQQSKEICAKAKEETVAARGHLCVRCVRCDEPKNVIARLALIEFERKVSEISGMLNKCLNTFEVSTESSPASTRFVNEITAGALKVLSEEIVDLCAAAKAGKNDCGIPAKRMLERYGTELSTFTSELFEFRCELTELRAELRAELDGSHPPISDEHEPDSSSTQ